MCMLLLCLLLFPLRQDASKPAVSMNILNYSTSKLVTPVDFAKEPSSSTLIRLHEYCSLFRIEADDADM